MHSIARQKWRFSTNSSLYIGNDTRWGHSYYETPIGTRMRYDEWCRFQWPWTIFNPNFKVTPSFDADCLRNDTRHNDNELLIGTRPTEVCHFEWPWVILSDYLMTQSIARPLCEYWASRCVITVCGHGARFACFDRVRLRCVERVLRIAPETTWSWSVFGERGAEMRWQTTKTAASFRSYHVESVYLAADSSRTRHDSGQIQSSGAGTFILIHGGLSLRPVKNRGEGNIFYLLLQWNRTRSRTEQ